MTFTIPSAEDIEPRLEAIEFLARSANRVVVLDTLAGGPTSRRDIEEGTGFSRATLSRTLAEFERRGWVDRDGRHHELTELGEFVAREFLHLLDRMAVAADLGDVARWFPEDGFGFDLARLAEADIVRPSKQDALAPTNNIVRRLEAAQRVRVMTYSVLPVCLETCWRRVVDGSQELDIVVERPVLAAMKADPTMTSRVGDLLRSDAARVFRYDGDLPFVVIVADDVVNLCLSDDDGAPHAVIDTTDGEIRDWAQAQFDSFRREATSVDSGALQP